MLGNLCKLCILHMREIRLDRMSVIYIHIVPHILSTFDQLRLSHK